MAKSSTSFAAGKSGNPAGRKKIKASELEAALAALGKTADGVVKDLLEAAIIWVSDPKASDRLRTYGHDYLARYIQGLPLQKHEVSGGISEEQRALLEALKMTPFERRKAMEAEAQDTTADADGG